MALELKKKPTQHHPATNQPGNDDTRPFDTRALDKLPIATDEDPPYRPWWAIDWT